MVGDAESDRQAAEQAGARFIGVVPRHVAVGETPTRGAGGEHPWNTPGSGVETVSDLSTLITSLL